MSTGSYLGIVIGVGRNPFMTNSKTAMDGLQRLLPPDTAINRKRSFEHARWNGKVVYQR